MTSSRLALLFAVALAALAGVYAALGGWGRGGPLAPETGLSLGATLEGVGFSQVEGPRAFRFPADHGSHPAYRSEWWYFTGNLEDTLGGEYGFQLTFFRSALVPDSGEGGKPAPWGARQAYMAHLALTEVGSGRFHAFERFSRASLGLAGVRTGPLRIWLEDWSCASEAGDTSLFPLKLNAAQGKVALDLRLEAGKPMVLQGDAGFSRKGTGEGNASYYYSFPRMPVRGNITTPTGVLTVVGAAWMDHEWGSSVLLPGTAGWDWFALQLSDSSEYLFFRLRKGGRPSTGDAASRAATSKEAMFLDYGIRIGPGGETRRFSSADMRAEIRSVWKSPRGRTYPARWRITVVPEALELEVTPKLPDQELNLSIPYWEGAVRIRGRRAGRSVEGRGYMELTGY